MVSQFEGFQFSLVDCLRERSISFSTAKNQSIKQNFKKTDESMTSNNNISDKLG